MAKPPSPRYVSLWGETRPQAAFSTDCYGRSGCSLTLAGVDGIVERRAGPEFWRLGRLDLDGLTGLRVAAGTGGALGDGEAADAGKPDFLATSQIVGDRREYRVDGVLGLRLALISDACDGIDNFGFGGHKCLPFPKFPISAVHPDRQAVKPMRRFLRNYCG